MVFVLESIDARLTIPFDYEHRFAEHDLLFIIAHFCLFRLEPILR